MLVQGEADGLDRDAFAKLLAKESAQDPSWYETSASCMEWQPPSSRLLPLHKASTEERLVSERGVPAGL